LDGCGHRKIRRKFLDLRGWRERAEHATPEEITTTQEVVIQIEAEAGAETKTDLYIVCFMRQIQIIEQGIVPSS
jgi:hypothetical protein